MHADDVLKYGHSFVMNTLDGLEDQHAEIPGACGTWSIKDIISHFASLEHVFIDVLNHIMDAKAPTPTLDALREMRGQFNDLEVEKRRGMTYRDVLAEYEQTQARVCTLLPQVPVETRRRPGTLPWYGAEYDLEDFLLYTSYANKREHCGQIAVFRDRLNAGQVS